MEWQTIGIGKDKDMHISATLALSHCLIGLICIAEGVDYILGFFPTQPCLDNYPSS